MKEGHFHQRRAPTSSSGICRIVRKKSFGYILDDVHPILNLASFSTRAWLPGATERSLTQKNHGDSQLNKYEKT